MEIDKTLPIYTISAVAKLTGVPIRMIREYEKQGLIKPKKFKGRRLFNSCEIGFINEIRYYLIERKMTIGGLKELYLRAGCWEIKQCDHKNCPCYGNIKLGCWQNLAKDKKCDHRLCPFCPIYIVKISGKKVPQDKPTSPMAFP